MRNVFPRMARAKLRLEAPAGELTVPEVRFPTFVCENVLKEGPCGALVTPDPHKELPYCKQCKRKDRCWRLATLAEVEAFDRRFLERFERRGATT